MATSAHSLKLIADPRDAALLAIELAGPLEEVQHQQHGHGQVLAALVGSPRPLTPPGALAGCRRSACVAATAGRLPVALRLGRAEAAANLRCVLSGSSRSRHSSCWTCDPFPSWALSRKPWQYLRVIFGPSLHQELFPMPKFAPAQGPCRLVSRTFPM